MSFFYYLFFSLASTEVRLIVLSWALFCVLFDSYCPILSSILVHPFKSQQTRPAWKFCVFTQKNVAGGPLLGRKAFSGHFLAFLFYFKCHDGMMLSHYWGSFLFARCGGGR